MSGIEKICEYSGVSPGYLMYEYKRNLIQISPEYRPLFKGKEFKLFRFVPDPNLCNADGNPMTDYCLYVPDLPGQVEGFYYNWTYNQWGIVKRKLKNLMGCRTLEEIRIPMSLYEFQSQYKYNQDTNQELLNSEELTNDDWKHLLKLWGIKV